MQTLDCWNSNAANDDPIPSCCCLRNRSSWEQSFSAVKHHSVLVSPSERSRKQRGRPRQSVGSGVNVAIIGLPSTSATEPNAGGSLSQPPVVHYGPHSALIRANPPWWAPARASCQRASSTWAALDDRGRFRRVTGENSSQTHPPHGRRSTREEVQLSRCSTEKASQVGWTQESRCCQECLLSNLKRAEINRRYAQQEQQWMLSRIYESANAQLHLKYFSVCRDEPDVCFNKW